MRRALHHLRMILSSWMRVLRLIWHTSPTQVVILLVLMVVSGLIPSAQIQITASIIQSASEAIRGGGAPQLVRIAVLFGLLQGGLTILLSLLSICQQLVHNLLQLKLVNNINVQIMQKGAMLDLQYFEDDAFYDTMQRANQESMYRPYQIFTQMTMLGGQCVTLASVVVVLFSWNWWLGLLILLAPLPSVCSQVFYGQRGYMIERKRSPQRRRLTYLQFLLTSARSVKEIRLFQLGDYFLKRYKGLYDNFYKVDSDLEKRQSLVLVPLETVSNAVAVGAQVYAIISSIAGGQIGILAGYLQAISVVQNTVNGILQGFSQLYQNNLFISNLFEFLDVSPRINATGSHKVPQRLQHGIEFRDVSFRYPGTTQTVLHDLNLFIPAGQRIALVGHNGAGKTTLVKLLTRLYEPTSGQILLDGVPLEEYDLQDLRRHISVIFQDFIQYEMTVRENIGFGYLEEMENDARIREAAQQSGADAIVDKLSNGYSTTLGRMFEKGHELSIGQWQKIALARAFMRQAPIVVLDEPTSAIDAEAETEIFNRLQCIAGGATTILIAHRFSTVRMAERIIVLDKGRIIEDGSHSELMQIDGMYAHLFQLQASAYMVS